jgi:hypothetical protein
MNSLALSYHTGTPLLFILYPFRTFIVFRNMPTSKSCLMVAEFSIELLRHEVVYLSRNINCYEGCKLLMYTDPKYSEIKIV